MNPSRVSPKDKAALKKMMVTHGVYEVVKALQEIAEKTCEHHANNPDAIIHRDEKKLRLVVEQMRDSHPLRLAVDG